METTLCWTGEKKNVRVRYLNSLGRETRERPQNSISNFWIVYILACRGEQFFSFTIIRNHGFYIHGIMLWSFFLTNFLVLHCASPSAHTIATSKVAVIFTSRLKRGIYGSFCSPYAFNSDFDNSTRLKGRLSWNSLQSIGVRAGGARGAAAPPNFGQLRFFWAARENLGKTSFRVF